MLTSPGSSGGAPHLDGGLQAGRVAGALDVRRALRGHVALQAAALGGDGCGQEGPEEDLLPGCESAPPTAAGVASLAPPTAQTLIGEGGMCLAGDPNSDAGEVAAPSRRHLQPDSGSLHRAQPQHVRSQHHQAG